MHPSPQTEAVRLCLLGSPELHGAGYRLPLPCERPMQLLAVLALAGDWVTRDRLAGLLWPERDAAAARSNLRKVVLLARRWLQGAPGAPPLQEQPGALRWTVATDAAQLRAAAVRESGADEALLRDVRGLLCHGWDAGLGPALEDWLGHERQACSALWRSALLTRAAQALDGAGHEALARAAAWAQRLLAIDPLDEDALRVLLRAQMRAGARADAQDALAGYTRRLAQETGLEPAADLQQLVTPATTAGTGPQAPDQPGVVPDDDALIGRRRELAQARAALAAGPCLLQLVGLGGVGKSTLLRHLLAPCVGDGTTQALVVDLADAVSIQDAADLVASACGVATGQAPDQVGGLLAARARAAPLVLGLDSAEALAEALPPWLHALHEAVPALRIVVASRVRLAPRGKAITLLLEGLEGPPAGETDIESFDAVQLYLRAARRARAGYRLDDDPAEAAAVAGLCAQVDGLPLALELAAGWMRHFRAMDLLQDVLAGPQALQGADHDAGTGRRSVQAVIEQTWALAVPAERQTLAAMSVFRGGFDMTAARAVAQASVPVLGSLLDKALLRRDAAGRYSLHALVRQHAAARLAEAVHGVDDAQVLRRHALHYAHWLHGLRAHGQRDAQALAAMRSEHPNLRAMWRHALQARWVDVLALAGPAYGNHLGQHGPHREGLHELADGLALLRAAGPAHQDAIVDTLVQLAFLHYHLGEFDAAERQASEGLADAAAAGSPGVRHRLLNALGVFAWARGELDRAGGLFQQALQALPPAGEDWSRAVYEGNLGLIALGQGRMDDARGLFARALAAHVRTGGAVGQIQQGLNLATVQLERGQFEDCVRLAGDALALARRIDYRADRAYGLRVVAQAEVGLRRFDAAREACLAALQALDEGAEAIQRPIVLATLAQALLGLGRGVEARAQVAQAAALALGGAQAIDQLSVLGIHGELLLAEGRDAGAAVVLMSVAAHASTGHAQRREHQALLDGLRARTAPTSWAAWQAQATVARVPDLLAEAAATLAAGPPWTDETATKRPRD